MFAPLFGDAGARVGDRKPRVPRTKFDVEGERAALRHRIEGVDGEVHEGLPEKVRIAPDRNALRPGAEVDGDRTPGGVGLNKRGDIAGNFGEVEFLLRHLDRAGEVEKGPDDAVEALDFFADDLDLLCRFGRVLPDHGFEQGQARRDGVERILDLMRDAAGQSIDGIETRKQSQLRLDLAAPLRVAQADERPPIREVVQGNQQRRRAAGARPLDETLGHAAALFEGFPQNRTERSGGDLKAIDGTPEQAFGRSAGKDEPLFGVEQEDPLFQALEHGVTRLRKSAAVRAVSRTSAPSRLSLDWTAANSGEAV